MPTNRLVSAATIALALFACGQRKPALEPGSATCNERMEACSQDEQPDCPDVRARCRQPETETASGTPAWAVPLVLLGGAAKGVRQGAQQNQQRQQQADSCLNDTACGPGRQCVAVNRYDVEGICVAR